MVKELTEYVLRLIEREDRYHEKKESMAWIAGSVYFTFSIGVISWIVSSGMVRAPHNLKMLLMFGLLLFYICALIFVTLQFKSRWNSVSHTATFNKAFQDGDIKNMKDIIDFYKFWEQDKSTYKKRNKLLMVLMTLLLPVIMVIFVIIIAPLRLLFLRFKPKSRFFAGVAKFFKKDLIDSRYMTEIPVYTIMSLFLSGEAIALFHTSLFKT